MSVSNTPYRRVVTAASSAITYVNVTSAGTNTWTQGIASTTSAIYVVGISTTTTSSSRTVDVGTGAAASEVAVASVWLDSGTNLVPIYIALPVPVRIPAGTRVSARTSINGAQVTSIAYVTESQVV